MKLKISKFLMCVSLSFTLSINAKILIFTYSYNRPDFIEIQHKTFKKFLLDDYEFIVFNDATNDTMIMEIEQMCQKHDIKCMRIPQEIHDPIYNASLRNCKVVQYSLNLLGYGHNDIVALFDSDMFLIKEFSIRDYLQNYDLAGLEQIRGNINYLWIGLVFLNMGTMPNKNTIDFNCGFIDGTNTDSGGFTHHYMKNNPEAKVRFFQDMLYVKDFVCSACAENHLEKCEHSIQRMKDLEFSEALIELACQSANSIMEIELKNTFLHYRAGSNWNYESAEYHERKTKILNQFISKLIE